MMPMIGEGIDIVYDCTIGSILSPNLEYTMNDQRIKEIQDRIDWMNENLSGCDWCCGGGDQEMAELQQELKELQDHG